MKRFEFGENFFFFWGGVSLYRSRNWRDERHNRNEEYIEDDVPGDYVNEGGGIN